MDTAAVLACLDLVITTDTAMAHLAGAMGRPAWVALSHAPEWRWQQQGETSPWYPSLRLFRQTAAGDWGGVFAEIADQLRTLVAQGTAP
jgi:ADP-heptose:LPS heptosyltransferase